MNTNKKIGIDQIVKEGEAILKECRKFRKDKGRPLTEDEHKELHQKCLENHREFAQIYMLPLRSIVYENQFYSDVMRQYCTYLTKNPWNSREEFLDRQAHYLVLMYRKNNPRFGSSDVARYREHVLKLLNQEDSSMKKYEKECKATVEKELEELILDRRKRIYDKLVQIKKAQEAGEKTNDEEKQEVSQMMEEISQLKTLQEQSTN